jgi:hypothetical protein
MSAYVWGRQPVRIVPFLSIVFKVLVKKYANEMDKGVSWALL